MEFNLENFKKLYRDNLELKDDLDEKVRLLAKYKKAKQENDARFMSERDEAREHVTSLVDVLRKWLKAYDDTGPDNGPSINEQDVANEALKLLNSLNR